MIWHCPLNKTSRHPNGYDYCQACSVPKGCDAKHMDKTWDYKSKNKLGLLGYQKPKRKVKKKRAKPKLARSKSVRVPNEEGDDEGAKKPIGENSKAAESPKLKRRTSRRMRSKS